MGGELFGNFLKFPIEKYKPRAYIRGFTEYLIKQVSNSKIPRF